MKFVKKLLVDLLTDFKFLPIFLVFILLILFGIVKGPGFIVNKVNAQAASFTFTAGGDYGATSNTTATLDKIAQIAPNFNLALGDLSYDQITPESGWCDYVKSHVGTTFPFELISGNHESDGFNGLIDNFAQCLPNRLGAITGTYAKEYYFDYPQATPLARFILISPNLTFTNGGLYSYTKGSDHYNWVASAIDNARAAGIKWVIVGMHEGCITAGVKGTCEIGQDLMNLLLAKKVDLILQAHDHTYQRSKQLALNSLCPSLTVDGYNSNCVVNDGSSNTYTKGAGAVVVISGASGLGNYDINFSDPEYPYFVKLMGNNLNLSYGITRYNISDSQITADFVPAVGTFSDNFTISNSSTSTPFTGTPISIPGTIEVENFDNGGEGVAYHDTDSTNNGGQYRLTEGVDIEGNGSGGYSIGWTKASEYLLYSINVTQSGSFDIQTKVASSGNAGNFHIEIDGTTVVPSQTVSDTGGWYSWKTLTTKGVNLSSGNHKLKLVMDSNGANGWVGNYDSITISPTQTAQSSYRVYPGNTNYTDTLGNIWSPDNSVASGGSNYATSNNISNTSDPTLYKSERYGNFSYAFPVSNGAYNVKLKFAEIYWTQAGKRVFNVSIENNPVLTNFDILSQTSPNTALDKTFTTNVSDGVLNINFSTVSDNAKISSIEITPSTSPTPTPTPSPSPTPGISLQIFADSLASGWRDVSYNATANYSNSSPVYTGSKSISCTVINSWGQCAVAPPSNITGNTYSTLHFALNTTNTNPNYQVVIADKSTNPDSYKTINLVNAGGNPSAGVWKVYDIPLSSMSVTSSTQIGAIGFQDLTGAKNPPIYYIDDLALK